MCVTTGVCARRTVGFALTAFTTNTFLKESSFAGPDAYTFRSGLREAENRKQNNIALEVMARKTQ